MKDQLASFRCKGITVGYVNGKETKRKMMSVGTCDYVI
jgi:hypothetical protein